MMPKILKRPSPMTAPGWMSSSPTGLAARYKRVDLLGSAGVDMRESGIVRGNRQSVLAHPDQVLLGGNERVRSDGPPGLRGGRAPRQLVNPRRQPALAAGGHLQGLHV